MTELRADCTRCAALCCVVPAFLASADFAITKKAGQPCPNLRTDFRCGIHSDLRDRGFTGCTVFDCFGAGQRVTQELFGGKDWRSAPELRQRMFGVYEVVLHLHELLYYLRAARAFDDDPDLDATSAAIDTAAADPSDVDIHAWRERVGPLLEAASARRRDGLGGVSRRGADLMGRDLRTMRLRGATLRGAYCIGANLSGVDLFRTDLLGTDLRGALLHGADLRETLFLTQSQVDAARGDATTRLPEGFRRPRHWA
ncbi:pentapeptide repeat-containing protein [Hamadaea tsunoensis]|uniref:pentapeptide repeat-containing protein n=1 Tax=Hamadaea tsunoensis TaxID=53368 RepID=UPI0006855521